MLASCLVLIKGAGDLASGVAHRLYRAGFQVVMTEQEKPTVVRRTVSFAQAVFEGEVEIEGVSASLAEADDIYRVMEAGQIPIVIDTKLQLLSRLQPQVFVEATLSKRNTGITREDYPLVIALGPGYSAGRDVHAVVETARGHYLGRVIYQGEALANTGVPGPISGFARERLLRAPCDGVWKTSCQIGDIVTAGETVAHVGDVPLKTQIDGIVRGLLHDGLEVEEGMKVGDIDPRACRDYCYSISDKARAVGGGVLEAILHFNQKGIFKTKR